MTKTSPNTAPLFLGIDTGGTYTDAVLWREGTAAKPAGTVVAKAKALTTRHDLAVGISGAVDRVLAEAKVDPAAIKLASMSTTLATNALVEGQGGRVALVMIGFSETDLTRDGLKTALGTDPVVFCPGGHDVHGRAAALDLSGLEAALPELAKGVSGFAVCAYFATRNPAHELAARDLIRERTGLPVTASHELSAKLGGPRRALTTLLNARLISMIDRLVAATEGFLAARKIACPLMVVRGDGALVSAAFARARPIETILSGPAASLVGARHMTGLDDAVVSDIGGTTTDVAVLDLGRPRLDPEGATVGGFRTMVEAVAMRTFGLGGDSEVALEAGALDPKILLGPRRLLPLSLSGMVHGAAVTAELERQLRAPNPGRLDGRFAVRTGVPERLAAGLTPPEAKLYEAIGAVPLPLDALLTSTAQHATLSRLVARGLVHVSGFTPSDAAHVLSRQSNWDADRRPPRRGAFRPPARRARPGHRAVSPKPFPSACSSPSPASRPRSSWKPPSPRTGSTARRPSRMRWSSARSTPITASRGYQSRSTGPSSGSARRHRCTMPACRRWSATTASCHRTPTSPTRSARSSARCASPPKRWSPSLPRASSASPSATTAARFRRRRSGAWPRARRASAPSSPNGRWRPARIRPRSTSRAT